VSRVLLVEDDPELAGVYALKLRLDGHLVQVAADAASAAAVFQTERPEVVCVDFWLPDRPGAELAQRLAMAGADVILLTNDGAAVKNPPPGVALALLKVKTRPSQLSAAIARLLADRPTNSKPASTNPLETNKDPDQG
jgi:DNA-binding response OmpR family regulator